MVSLQKKTSNLMFPCCLWSIHQVRRKQASGEFLVSPRVSHIKTNGTISSIYGAKTLLFKRPRHFYI